MRCFLGFDLSAKAKMQLDEWRSKALFIDGVCSAVKPANFHITSWFIGNINNSQIDAIVSNIDRLIEHSDLRRFDVHLNDLLYWSKPKIVCAVPSQPPESLSMGQVFSQKVCKQAGVIAQGNSSVYKPHVTLYRKVKSDSLISPLFMPEVRCWVTQLHLFESVAGNNGVQYIPRFSFTLPSGLSEREQLKQGLQPQ